MARESSPDSGGAGADMELGDLKTERRNEIRAVLATVSTVPTNWHQVCSRLLLCCSCAEIQDPSRSSSATRHWTSCCCPVEVTPRHVCVRGGRPRSTS